MSDENKKDDLEPVSVGTEVEANNDTEPWPEEHLQLGFRIMAMVQSWSEFFQHPLDDAQVREDIRDLLRQLADALPETNEEWEAQKAASEKGGGMVN